MAKQPPALSMSQLIANDAPLLSPVSMGDSWDSPESFSYPYYMPLSPAASPEAASPVQSTKILKMRMSPDASQEQESLCLPTSQVFDLSEPAPAQTPVAVPEPPKPVQQPPVHPVVTAVASTATKRSASPAAGATKKRATERVSSKDFVPPDVTGLSKREARLVKNRAAAFLSRQRKREEFETMEMYVMRLILSIYAFLNSICAFFFTFQTRRRIGAGKREAPGTYPKWQQPAPASAYPRSGVAL